MRVRVSTPSSETYVPTRAVPLRQSHEVVDILREYSSALVVCVKCGQTWDEADVAPEKCR